MFPFDTGVQKYRKRTLERNRFRYLAGNRFKYFFFLSTSTEKISIYFKYDQQIQLVLPARSGRDRGIFVSKMKKLDQYFTLCHIPLTLKEFQYIFFTFPSKEFKASLIKNYKGVLFSKVSTSKQVFLKIFEYSQENTCVGVSF